MEQPINQHQCFACCLKHLASALVIAGEIRTGYDSPDYHLYLLGNLAEAQEQVALRAPQLANAIRQLRLRIFGDGGQAQLDELAVRRLERLSGIVQQTTEQLTAKPEKPELNFKRPCRCRKKLENQTDRKNQ